MAALTSTPDETFMLEGMTVGRLKVLERVRSGVAGALFLAIDEAAGRSLTVEILFSEIVESASTRRALADEARAAAALADEGIAPLVEVGEVDGRMVLAMDPLRGTSLQDVAARGPLQVAEVLRIGTSLARTLAAAHAAGLSHRHLAPRHVVVTPEDRVLVLGFGLSTWGEGAPTASQTRFSAEGARDEAREYAAPEQLRGEAGDARADVFALGALLRELSAGDLAGVPVVARCLDADPSARFAHAGALLAALASLADGAPAKTTVSMPPGPDEPAPRHLASTLRIASRQEPPAPPPPAARVRAPGEIAVRMVRDDEGGVNAEQIELVSLAGSGGMGDVYRARHASSGKELAVKLLSREGGDARRFAREAAVLASFHHPGVVSYEGHGVTDDGTLFLAMEWLDGEGLDAALERGPLSTEATLALARRVAEALAAAHLRGIVHRDLKPANLFLVGGRVDTPKVLDFGLARTVAESGLTAPGTVLGTPAYMSPEQIRGEAVDARADVYGLGAVIFRCLAGHPPFGGEHRIAVLAKVLVEDPPRLSHLVPGVPRGLDALVRRMLSKDPDRRPPDGAAVVEAILGIDAHETAEPSSRAKPTVRSIDPAARATSGITAHEQRIACVVLCSAPGPLDATLPAGDSGVEQDVRAAVEGRGGVLEVLMPGTWMVTVRGAASPAEQAARAVRCALAVAAARPSAPVVVATGRVVAAGETQVGEVIDRAAAALLAPESPSPGAPGEVLVDEGTAALLDDRFEVTGGGPWRRLLGEQSSLAPVRTLLGRPASCVGRTQELSALAAALEECAEEPRAHAVLVTAPPGVGKSRLVHELLTTAVAARGDVDVLFARGDAVRMGSPFGIASQMLRRAAAILDSDAAPARQRKLVASLEAHFEGAALRRLAELLGEICGTPVRQEEASPALRAARADAAVMGDALREAWVDWLRVRVGGGCALLVVEDLHWADLPSIRLLDAALDALSDQPLMVLATARPEVHARFPDVWQKRRLQQISLGPLTRRAAQRLVREALGARVPATVQDAIVDRAAGHPFHLEELVRAVASGHGPGALPDSVLGMIQARLEVLGPVARRALRAASVFGEIFWSGGVRAVMGDDVPEGQVALHLGRLAEEEVVTRRSTSRIEGETEYAFRHALVRDAAYATLTERDRALAHRLAGAWLEGVGESDPAMLAEHYHRGGAPEDALRHLRKAAEQAFEGDDLDRAASFAERALACGPDPATEGAIWGLEAEVAYWRGRLDDAAERASRAAARLTEGSAGWFGAVSVAIGAFGQRGMNEEAATWLTRAARAGAGGQERGALAVTLCRGMTQLFWAHHDGDLGAARARLDELTQRPEALDPYESGWVHRVRGESAWLHDKDLDRCRAELCASCEAFEQASAQRSLCLTQMNWASLAGWSGETDRGLDLVERARREAVRIGAGFLVLYGMPVRGLVEAYAGLPTAAATMREALAVLGNSPRLAFITRIVLGCLALDAGDVREAGEHAAEAVFLPVVPDLRPAGLALRSRVRCAEGRLDEALADAIEAARLASAREDLELTAGMSDLALAEAHDARGDRGLAREAIAAGHARLTKIAATIADPEGRRRFWARRLPNDRIAALAIAWGVATRGP